MHLERYKLVKCIVMVKGQEVRHEWLWGGEFGRMDGLVSVYYLH